MGLPHHLKPTSSPPQPCYTEDRLPYASSMTIRPRSPVWLTPQHWLSFSLFYMSSICGQMLSFLCQEIKSFFDSPDRMSPGPAGLQDCASGGWWAMIWQTVNHSLAGSSALDTGKELGSTISPSGPSFASPRLLASGSAPPVSGHSTPIRGTYFAPGQSQALLYIGPGCDLRSA